MKPKKLLPKHHTGKLVHRHHTAYGLLLLVLVFVMLPLFAVSTSVAALSAPPMSAEGGMYAVVAAPVPETAPVIRSLTSGQIFSTAELHAVAGSCQKDTVVRVYKNRVLAGSDLCGGSFNVDVDLFVGPNSIIARSYNSNNIAGPDSAPVNVTLNLDDTTAAGAPSVQIDQTNQLVVTSDVSFQGVRTQDTLKWPITIAGGKAPYAVSVGWGDGKSDLISKAQPGAFEAGHIYDKPGSDYRGSYDVTIQVTDETGEKAFIQLVAIVSDSSPSAVSNAKTGYDVSRVLQIAWKLLIAGLLVIAIFWLGEQYEVRILKKKYRIVQ